MAMCRRCSHCGHNGHNSRTCAERGGVKLFGVCISDSCGSMAMRKSASMGSLTEVPSSSSCAAVHDGYASDDLVHTCSNARERKRGVAWTEEEHKLFLLALRKLGKGDWRGISRNFVKTRTPTQVASHAQKYFLRQSNLNKRRRRSSLFDITHDTVSSIGAEEASTELLSARPSLTDGSGDIDILERTPLPTAGFHLTPAPASHSYFSIKVPVSTSKCDETDKALLLEGCESMNSMQPPTVVRFDVPFRGCEGLTGFDPAVFLYYPWAGGQGFCHPGYQFSESKIVKPVPIVPTAPVRIDEPLKIAKLNLGATRPVIKPTPLSLELSEMGSRHSAFHSMPLVGNLERNTQGSLCNVISVA